MPFESNVDFWTVIPWGTRPVDWLAKTAPFLLLPLAARAAQPNVVYLLAEGKEQQALLAKIGKHKMGKSCLYFRRLADIDVKVLERLVVGSLAQLKSRYG